MKKIVLAALAAAVVASSADAAVFNFSFTTAANAVVASGTLTTADTLNSLGGYSVLSISGTADGVAITGMIGDPYAPQTGYYLANGTISSNVNSNWVWSFDNTVFTPATPHLDNPGLLFETGSNVYNVFKRPDDTLYTFGETPIGGTNDTERSGTFTLTAAAAAVPEPASWAMMVGGFGLLGGALRRKKASVRFA